MTLFRSVIETMSNQHLDIFNTKLEERLDEKSFMVDGVAGFDSAYLDDIKNNKENLCVILDRGINLTDEYYGDMFTEERLEVDDEEAMDKYFNVDIILYVRSANEQQGHVAKRSRELDGKVVRRAHTNS